MTEKNKLTSKIAALTIFFYSIIIYLEPYRAVTHFESLKKNRSPYYMNTVY